MFKNVEKTFWKIAIPMLVIMVADQLFNIIDFWFISQLSDSINSRDNYVTAIWIVFPIFFVIIASSLWISTGVNNIVSIYLGKKDEENKNVFIWIGILFSFVLYILLLLSADNIINYGLHFFQTSPNVHLLAMQYLKIIFEGSIFIFLMNIALQILSVYQDYKVQITFALLSLAFAVFLDWLLVFYLWYGIEWGAYATIITWAITSFILWIYIRKKQYFVYNFTLKKIYSKKNIKEFQKYFFPALLSHLFIMWEFVIINKFVSLFWEDALAGYAIGFKLQSIFIMVFIAFWVTLMIMYGFYSGSKDTKRILQVEKLYLKVWIITSIIIGIILFIISSIFPLLFTDSQAIADIAQKQIFVLIPFFILFVFVFWVIVILQITGNGKLRVLHSLLTLVFIFVFQLFLSTLSIEWVFLWFLFSNILITLIFWYYALKIRKEKLLHCN